MPSLITLAIYLGGPLLLITATLAARAWVQRHPPADEEQFAPEAEGDRQSVESE